MAKRSQERIPDTLDDVEVYLSKRVKNFLRLWKLEMERLFDSAGRILEDVSKEIAPSLQVKKMKVNIPRKVSNCRDSQSPYQILLYALQNFTEQLWENAEPIEATGGIFQTALDDGYKVVPLFDVQCELLTPQERIFVYIGVVATIYARLDIVATSEVGCCDDYNSETIVSIYQYDLELGIVDFNFYLKKIEMEKDIDAGTIPMRMLLHCVPKGEYVPDEIPRLEYSIYEEEELAALSFFAFSFDEVLTTWGRTRGLTEDIRKYTDASSISDIFPVWNEIFAPLASGLASSLYSLLSEVTSALKSG